MKRLAVQLVSIQYQLEDVGIMKIIALLLSVTFQQVCTRIEMKINLLYLYYMPIYIHTYIYCMSLYNYL